MLQQEGPALTKRPSTCGQMTDAQKSQNQVSRFPVLGPWTLDHQTGYLRHSLRQRRKLPQLAPAKWVAKSSISVFLVGSFSPWNRRETPSQRDVHLSLFGPCAAQFACELAHETRVSQGASDGTARVDFFRVIEIINSGMGLPVGQKIGVQNGLPW